MAELFTNLAESAVASVSGGGSINNVTDPVTFNVLTGDGAKFPAAALGSGNYFHAIIDTGTAVEILRCQRNGDIITADRAQEGTAKVAHSLGVRFAHVVTAASLQSIPAYVQSSALTTKGDVLTRDASGPVRQGVGANGTSPIADSTQTTGWRWGTVAGGGGGAGTQWQLPAYTIYYDGTNYSARNERTATVDYTSNTSLHNVFNSATAALGTTNTSFLSVGGAIYLATPTGHVMTTNQPLLMYDQISLFGPGRGLTIQAGGSSWTGGTLASPNPVLNCHNVSRIRVEGIRIDCAGKSGSTGIQFTKGSGATGGNSAHSYFLFNEVTGYDVSGIQIGLNVTPKESGGTSTAWLFGNQIVNDVPVGDNSIGVAFFVGDAHYGWGNNIKIGGDNSIGMVIQANSVHVLNGGHMVNNGISTQPLISVHGCNPCRIEGVYFDNLSKGPAVGINLDDTKGNGSSPYTYNMSGQANRVVISNNWVHVSGNANTLSPFKFDNTQGGGNNVSGITVANNVMEADVTTMKSMVDIINGSSTAKIQNTLAMVGNQAANCTNFLTVDNGPAGPAVGGGASPLNIIQDSATNQRYGP